MNRIEELTALGQSIWLDFIERRMVQSGELADLVAQGVRGVTSNPTIFQQAIAKSDAYKDDLTRLAGNGAESGADAKTIFEPLAVADIQAAADVLRPVYDAAEGHDGFVSLEVAPTLAAGFCAVAATMGVYMVGFALGPNRSWEAFGVLFILMAGFGVFGVGLFLLGMEG